MVRRKPIKILVAVDSIVYAPLYAFVERNSTTKSEFLFQIEPVHKPLQISHRHRLKGLAPITYDPVFSPVIEKSNFKNPRYEYTWFGVGDPLRVTRIKWRQSAGLSFEFVGTLISRMAQWIIADRNVKFGHDQTHNYNYVACHPKGMTGYYLAEYLFRTTTNNPLAPTWRPNLEIDHALGVLNMDSRRRPDPEDAVWIAALTMQIGKILMVMAKGNNGSKFNYHPVYKVFPKIPEDYLFTAIVARRDEGNRQHEIEDATKHLTEGLIEAISWFRDENETNQLIKHLKRFYRSRASFALPKRNDPLLLRERGTDIIHEIKDLYPSQLQAETEARTATDSLLASALRSELKLSSTEVNETFNDYFEKLRTANWGNSSEKLWKSTAPTI
jgi:hypothetical protein